MPKSKKETEKRTMPNPSKLSSVLARTLRKDFEKETGKRLRFTPLVSNNDLYIYWLEREYDKLEKEYDEYVNGIKNQC
jgi:hypothetical protein